MHLSSNVSQAVIKQVGGISQGCVSSEPLSVRHLNPISPPPLPSLNSLHYFPSLTFIDTSSYPPTQISSALAYLHTMDIIYRDCKSDNVLVCRFPDPHDLISRGVPLDTNVVLVKLSDYGISQFAATQGARGLVGTPGFMAPEILKYHGREVYSHQVDIFSFAMLIYEMITLHTPYENLTAQQANQSNENGARPSLSRKVCKNGI